MKKHLMCMFLGITMIIGQLVPYPVPVMAKGGNTTLIASGDTYVQGASQATVAKGAGDPENLNGRDWSDKDTEYGAYMLPYVKFEVPSVTEFENPDDIKAITLKMFCVSGDNDEYVVGISRLNDFDELKLTYNNAISAEGQNRINFDEYGRRIEGSNVRLTAVANEWVEFDITNGIKPLIEENTTGKPKTVVLAVSPRSRGDFPQYTYHGSVVFRSKEYQGGIYAPRMEIKADAYTTKIQREFTNYYTDEAEMRFENQTLAAGGGLSTFISIDTALLTEVMNGDSVSGGRLILYKKDGSESTVTVQDENSDWTSQISVPSAGGAVEIDIGGLLRQCFQNGDVLTLRLTSDAAETVYFHSTRTDLTEYAAKLEYDIIYEGQVERLMPVGDEQIEISLTSTKEIEYGFEAYDKYNEAASKAGIKAEYILEEAPSGVSITPKGVLKVLPDAMPGTAVIRVYRADMPEISGTLTVEVYLPDPGYIEILGGVKAKLPESGATLRKPYTAEIYTADGVKMPNVYNILWSVSDASEGISVEREDDGSAVLVIVGNDKLQLGDRFQLIACIENYPSVSKSFEIEIGAEDEVYNRIVIPASADTYIKKSDYTANGNKNSDELLTKMNTKTSKIVETIDYFSKEGTNREAYLKFEGLSMLPENISTAHLQLTADKSVEESDAAPISAMPRAQLFLVTEQDWSEEEGTLTRRLAVQKGKISDAVYGMTKNSKTSFDVTSVMRGIIDGGEDSASFRVSMQPVNNNYYLHSYYSKEATVYNELTNREEPVNSEYVPQLVITASYVRVPNGVRITGTDRLGIMLNETSAEYKVYLIDQYGQQYTDEEMKAFETGLSLDREYPGIELEGNTLRVQPEAEAAVVTLRAEAGGFSGEKAVEVYKSEAALLKIDGLDRIKIPSEGEKVTATYTLNVFDQNGVEIAVDDAVYTQSVQQVGVTVDSVTGVVTVYDYAVPNREFTILVYSASHPNIRVEKSVRLLPNVSIEGKEQHPNLIYGNNDLVALRKKIKIEPFSTYYDSLKQTANSYSAKEIQYYADNGAEERMALLRDEWMKKLQEEGKINKPEEVDECEEWLNAPERLKLLEEEEYNFAYPVVDEETGKVQDRKRPWQWLFTDLFYTQGSFTFTPPSSARYVKVQAIAKGQGIVNFDNVYMDVESGAGVEIDNASFETGTQRRINEDLDYTDGAAYQTVATSKNGEWEYLNDVKNPMPDNWHYIKKSGSDTDFEWDNQVYNAAKVTSTGTRAAKIRNNTVTSEAGISSDYIAISPKNTYVLSTGYGANDKLVGKEGKKKEYEPLDPTARIYMQVVYFDENKNEIGTYSYIDAGGRIINWQVKPLRRGFDSMMEACATIYAVEKNLDYAIKAKELLKYQLEDMRWGMQYRTTTGYNKKMNDSYEAVHTGRSLQRDAVIYDMIYDSGVIDAEEDARIRELMQWIAYTLTQTSYYNYTTESGRIHNYNADRISGLAMFMLCFPDNPGRKEMNYKDNYQYYYDHVMNENNVWSFPNLLKNGVYDAGENGAMWCENIRYHTSVLNGWMLMAKALDRSDPANNYMNSKELKQMAKLWVTAQGPRLVTNTEAKNLAGYPTFGDSAWRQQGTNMACWYASLFAQSDPELSRELMFTWDRMGGVLGGAYPINVLLDNDPTLPRQNPQLGSVTMENIGNTYFRKNFDVLGKEYLTFIPNSPGYGNGKQIIHDHYDRGSFSFFANGTPMSLDIGMGSYFGSDSSYFRGPWAHNQVMFWDGGSWASNSGGDNNSGKSVYDSKTSDFFTSQEMDYVKIEVNTTRPQKRWNRHFAFLKDGIDALIIWDECLGDAKTLYNFFMTSKSFEQSGNMLLAQMHNDMEMEVFFLNSENPDITSSWAPSRGGYALPLINDDELQQNIRYEHEAGRDYLTVLYPKEAGVAGLSQSQVNTGNDNVKAFKMTSGQTDFYIVFNDGDSSATFRLGNTSAVRNIKTGDVYDANAQLQIDKGEMMIVTQNSLAVPQPVRIELTGNTSVGVPVDSQSLTYYYEARAFDQYDNSIDYADIDFEIVNDVDKCSVSDKGELIIEEGFPGGTAIQLRASAGSVSAELQIFTASKDTAAASVGIIGSNTLVIPDSGAGTYTYQASFKNVSGGSVSNVKPIWTILDAPKGVTVNSYTGTVTIESAVEPKTIMHLNVSHYNDPSITATLEVILVKAAETGIYANVPQQFAVDGISDKELQLIGYVTDQQGGKYKDGTVTFSLKQGPDGVTLDSRTGLLKISRNVSAGNVVTVQAVSDTNPQNCGTYKMTLVNSMPESIAINGADSITARESTVSEKYMAVIKDQDGTVLNLKVIWSVNGIAGASVDENGTVSIPADSPGGTLRLTAVADGYSEISVTKKITVNPAAVKPGGSGGGGSSGGKGGTVGGGGLSGNSGTIGQTEKQYTTFTDVPVSHWAYSYIEQLVRDGVINGKTESTFEPDSSVTRAEFVKMVMLAFDFEPDVDAALQFEDVQPSDWYSDYVMTAASLGIVNGVSEHMFGAGDLITREQMAAIIYRALEAVGKAPVVVWGQEFSDMEEISGYAKNIVLALKSAGLINGKEEKRFMPKDNTTRAEAAKLISCAADLK